MKRLRAVLTSQTMLTLVLLMVGIWMLLSLKRTGETALEERIADTLSAMNGVGEVHVVIATKEVRTQRAMGIADGQMNEIPCGAVAVADGADDPWVQAQMTNALCALLGLPASAVSVISGGD